MLLVSILIFKAIFALLVNAGQEEAQYLENHPTPLIPYTENRPTPLIPYTLPYTMVYQQATPNIPAYYIFYPQQQQLQRRQLDLGIDNSEFQPVQV